MYSKTWYFLCVLVLCTQVDMMFVMLLWVCIHTGQAEKFAWPRWESNPRPLGYYSERCEAKLAHLYRGLKLYEKLDLLHVRPFKNNILSSSPSTRHLSAFKTRLLGRCVTVCLRAIKTEIISKDIAHSSALFKLVTANF
jgi:hypothetical protein